MDFDLSWWGFTIFLIAITTFPVKLAAEFVGAKRNTLKHSALSVLIATVAILFLFYSLGNITETYLVSFLIVVLIFKYVLIPPPGYIVWLSVLALVIQLGVISAVASYGKYSGNYFFAF